MKPGIVSDAATGPAPIGPGPIFLDFVFLLRESGIAVGVQEVLDFYSGLARGIADTLDSLFLFARLVFVKRVAQLDAFERAFCLYFYDIRLPRVAEGDPELLHTKQFRDWLAEAVKSGELPPHAFWSMSREELMRRFWERVREQMEAHHGGGRWVGTGGTSPFGHSGHATRGIRVFGQSGNRSAVKVVGDRRYVAYDEGQSLKGANLRQVLGTLRHMVPVGPESELDLDETIRRTAKNGGEIDLIFRRHELDRLKLVVLIDNGGTSMLPFVGLTQLLFSKLRDRFKDSRTYYFHNTVYGQVYTDPQRRKPFPLKKLLEMPRDTRVFLVGDASMAPEELLDAYGAIEYGTEEPRPSIENLAQISKRFKYSVWLNPIPKEEWAHTFGRWTLSRIGSLFFMEDLTIRGIKKTVSHLRRLAASD